MTKRSLNDKKANISKNKKIKRIRFKLKKIQRNKNNSSKNSTTNVTQKDKNIINKKEKLSTNIGIIQNNMNTYSSKLISNHFETYAKNIMVEFLEKEAIENKKIINKEILYKYNITPEHRKSALKYLYNFIKYHKINIQCFFSAVSIFDLFLINYSEDKNNDCKTFFYSKKENIISETKLILFVLCCFYIIAKFFNTKVITVDQLYQFENAKNEVNYDSLIELIDNIMIYTDLKIAEINIYNYIELYLVDILKRMKELTYNQKFLGNFQKYAIYYGTRIVQSIDLLDILQSIQALGIIIFSFEYSKFVSEENNIILDKYLKQWKENLENLIINYDVNNLEKILNWLNVYISK